MSDHYNGLNHYFCPNCHMSTFGQHHDPDHRDWNKCRFCGYMELIEQSLQRVNCKLSNSIDCACKYVCEKTIDVKDQSSQIQHQDHQDDPSSSTTKDQPNQEPLP